MNADSVIRVDEQYLNLMNLVVQVYNSEGKPDTTISMEEAAFDLVFCEQVLEHVPDPVQASRNLFALTRPGGFAVVSVPFMVRIHREPEDYWRFSPAGLRVLLERAGFEVERVEGWGSRASVLANLWVWCPYIPIVHSLANSSATPLVVWAVARKPKLPQ
jgi:SAM-dependent methyltransferase